MAERFVPGRSYQSPASLPNRYYEGKTYSSNLRPPERPKPRGRGYAKNIRHISTLILLDTLILKGRYSSEIPVPNKGSHSVRYLLISTLSNQIKIAHLPKDLVNPDLEHQALKKSLTILYYEILSLPKVSG